MIYAYHRVSTTEQHLDKGITEIKEYCKNNNMSLNEDNIYTDKQTGKNFNRPDYIALKKHALRSGDTLIIAELDRLGRNKQDTMKEIQYFKDNNIRLMVLELPTTLIDLDSMDNNTAKLMLDMINNLLLELYASMAQAEIEKKEKRQREGIQAKKDRGDWDDYGRPKAFNIDKFRKEYKAVQDGTKKPFELMKELGLTKPTFYRYKKMIETDNTNE